MTEEIIDEIFGGLRNPAVKLLTDPLDDKHPLIVVLDRTASLRDLVAAISHANEMKVKFNLSGLKFLDWPHDEEARFLVDMRDDLCKTIDTETGDFIEGTF